MATSRDDFVIAIRSVFLKKGNQQRFSLIGLICFCVVLIFLSRINFSALKLILLRKINTTQKQISPIKENLC